jgi:hypothetical protein
VLIATFATFSTQAGAEQFKSYTDKHGIWVSVQHPQRGPVDYKMEIEGLNTRSSRNLIVGFFMPRSESYIGAEARFWGKDGNGTVLPQNGDLYKGWRECYSNVTRWRMALVLRSQEMRGRLG